ncbi:fatty acid desaturase family protein [Micromonospora phaseoli]|nr:acyl-CoA desaturase [Micromonospora phaseoli]
MSGVRPGSPRRRSDYAELLSQVRQAGLLERRPIYYGIRIALNAALVVAGWTIFVMVGESWWQLLTAVFLAVMFTQTGFIGHDAGHRQIFRSRRANDLVGLLHGNLAIGLAFGWWVDKHHRHHANPNQEGLDPDISGEAIVFTPAQARLRRGAGRFLARHQGVLFFPMLLLEGLNLHVASVRALFRSSYRERGREAVLLGLHTVGYLAVVIAVLSPLQALAFVVVQQGLFGVYLGLAFAPNHKGMPILAEDDDTDFFRRQVLTSRNVRGSRLTDFMLGGLNHQIEHHLFPSMPRASLRHARPIVRAFCLDRGVPYVETTLLDSYRQAVHHLHTVGRGDQDAEPTGHDESGPAARSGRSLMSDAPSGPGR